MGALENHVDEIEEEEITRVSDVPAQRNTGNEIQALQDLLVYALKGISMYAMKCRKLNIIDGVVDMFTARTLRMAYVLSSTDPTEIAPLLKEALQIRSRAKTLYEWACTPEAGNVPPMEGPASFPFDVNPYNIGVQAQIISFERLLKGGSTTHVFLEDICLLELTEHLERSNAPKLNGQSDGTVHTLVHQVLSTLAKHPTTSELTWLADRLSDQPDRYQSSPEETNPEYHPSNHTDYTNQPSPLRPTVNIRLGKKNTPLGQ